MKRIIFAFIALLTLLAGFAQLQHVLPITVQRYMDERQDQERLMRYYGAGGIDSYKSQFAPSYKVNDTEMVDAFIDIESPSAIPLLRANGVIVNCVFDSFMTAQVPVDRLEKISQIPGVSDVEVSRLVELCTDTTLRVTHAGQVINGPDFGLPQAYDGSGVIVGVIDVGFDYRHLAFRCADDTSRTRIVRVYDELNETGHPVMIGGNKIVGSVFMGEQLDTMTYDTNGSHGTHTASIAAGLHVNGYGGMAPNADIVLCAIRNLDLSVPETKVVNAMKYIYSYADSVGKPCVISLSVSTKQGAHDGNDRISKAAAQLTGPGRIFVVASGNNGNNYFYTHGPATVDKPLNIPLGQSYYSNADEYYYYKSLWLDAWVRDLNVKATCKFHIFDRQAKRIVWESDLISVYKRIDVSEISQYYSINPSVDTQGYLSAVISRNSSGKNELQFYAYNLKTNSYTIDGAGGYHSRYMIGVSIYPPSLAPTAHDTDPDSCYIDSWMCMGTSVFYNDVVYQDVISEAGDTTTETIRGFYSKPSPDCSINTYAINDSIISVGAFIGRTFYYSLNENRLLGDPNGTPGGLYFISGYELPGHGPTGQHLPTVMAPGFYVVAAGSRYSYFQTVVWHPDLVMRTEGGYLWGVMSGTSMAAPTVAGIIAQWLQIEPTLSPSQVKDVIARTAIKDSYTQDQAYGKRFGPNGKIDAFAGAQYLLSLHEEETTPGDINGDGRITVGDVTMLVSYVLGTDLGVNVSNADLTGDGNITVTDVTRLISMVLGLGIDPADPQNGE